MSLTYRIENDYLLWSDIVFFGRNLLTSGKKTVFFTRGNLSDVKALENC